MKIPKARKLKSGKWNIQMRLEGQSVSVTRPTKAECEKEARRIKQEHKDGLLRPAPLTLRTAIDKYIEDRSNILSPSTIRGYRKIQRCHFQDLMDTPVAQISDIQGAVNKEADKHSGKTVKNAYGLVKAVLGEYIVMPPVRLPPVVRSTRPFLDPDEIKSLLAAAQGDKSELAILLALHSLRRSELLAITKADLADGQIRVNKTRVLDENGVWLVKPVTKTNASNRVIPIMIPRLADIVPELPEEGFVVGSPPSCVTPYINDVCRRAGVPEVGAHGLRHSFASLGYFLGIGKQECARMGGWSDLGTMEKIYTHIYEKELTRSQNAMASFYSDIR